MMTIEIELKAQIKRLSDDTLKHMADMIDTELDRRIQAEANNISLKGGS